MNAQGKDAGILQKVQPLNPTQITQIENEVLEKHKIAFYLEPNGTIRLVTSWPIEHEVRNIAWNKLDLLVTENDKEYKYEYFRTSKNKINLNLSYEREVGLIPWRPILSEKTALLGKARLGKIILGRRY